MKGLFALQAWSNAPMMFADKVALVAGAGGGMGLNIANDLLGEGAHVCLADIKPRPADFASDRARAPIARAICRTEASCDRRSNKPSKPSGVWTTW